MSSSLFCTLDSLDNSSLSELSSGMKIAIELTPIMQSLGAKIVGDGSVNGTHLNVACHRTRGLCFHCQNIKNLLFKTMEPSFSTGTHFSFNLSSKELISAFLLVFEQRHRVLLGAGIFVISIPKRSKETLVI